ncbi:MAG: peptide ligase PGM1-related protein [Acidimicrobiia bacterium]
MSDDSPKEARTNTSTVDLEPRPGSPEEAAVFDSLQARFPDMYRRVFSDPKEPRTVVVIPSMSLDQRELVKIPGAIHYEERMLCLLMLLRLPRTQLIYVTSTPLDAAVIDYYLHLLPGIPGMHARKRLHLISCEDPSLTPLSQKILDRPSKLEELRRSIQHPESAHMTCFNSSHLERTLAVQLAIPMYACDPALSHLGNKSESRRLFRQVGMDIPRGHEDLRDRADLAEAVLALSKATPPPTRAVIKLNDGFSGEGNAVIDLDGLADVDFPEKEIHRRITNELGFVAQDESWEPYEVKLETMGGIIEEMIDVRGARSPSVQMRIDPLGEVQTVSTHDQILAGPNGQVYEGCTFPARAGYRSDLHDAGRRVGSVLRDIGVLGRFGIDFISVPEGDGWRNYAIEINLRKGGTTLPYLMLEFLTDGSYDWEEGVFRTPTGDTRSYYATDNLVDPRYKGLRPDELIDIAVYEGLHYHATAQTGVVFHLLGAVTDHGKIGMLSIAPTRKGAKAQYREAVTTLDRATRVVST